MTIRGLHEGKASNGQFSIKFLIDNDHSEPPRGGSWGGVNVLNVLDAEIP